MCLAVPGRIEEIYRTKENLKMAKVNFAGVEKEVCLEWIPDATVGEYVMVHVGFALNKVNERDALETIRILREMGDIPERGGLNEIR